MKQDIKTIVENLNMAPHPEGGFYKETYRSTDTIPQGVLGDEFTGDRNYCTGIYFLLTSLNFSAFHRIKQDEMWHYYTGSSLYVHVIDPNGNYHRQTLGINFENGELPQYVVPAGSWFASSVKDEDSFSLVGCTVAPGFDFDDFELANRKSLIEIFPDHKELISQYTRI